MQGNEILVLSIMPQENISVLHLHNFCTWRGVWVALIWNDHSLKTAAVKIRTALSITVMAVIQTITLKSIAKHALKISQHRHADTAG